MESALELFENQKIFSPIKNRLKTIQRKKINGEKVIQQLADMLQETHTIITQTPFGLSFKVEKRKKIEPIMEDLYTKLEQITDLERDEIDLLFNFVRTNSLMLIRVKRMK